jgi:hypothetical protein
MNRGYDLLDALAAIPPDVHYDEHLAVGQALHHEGYGVEAWRDWTAGCAQPDHAKRLREIDYKWGTFGNNAGSPVTGGTIVKLARDHGWTPGGSPAKAYEVLPWDVTFYEDDDEPPIVDASSVSEHDELVSPVYGDGHALDELRDYLMALFDEGDTVRYVLDATAGDDGRMRPGVGVYKRTAGDLLKSIEKAKSLDDVVGTLDDAVGAYICINPLDGEYIGNKNVASYRHALVESDDMERGKFAAIVKQLNLPVVAMVDSGNKSLHAIVKIDADDARQYAERVRVLYERCERNGIAIDKANKNPSRLSRMPGAVRNGKRQFLAGLRQGAGDWEEWEAWYAEETDELPESVPLDSMLGDNLPPLKPALIDGLLRVGHKMLVSGPSKAGKSFALINLCIAFAEGLRWFGFTCRRSRVMYVNLELDGDSCINRFNDIYGALGIEPAHAGSIDVWNLRGKAEPMGRLLPKLVRRCLKRGVEVVVIDPIYKISVGDENNAGDMTAFANLFDALCDQAGVSVIYCHHHSKGFQGQKRSIDRASGSGVFGRDPDAILDLVELDAGPGMKWKRVQDKVCAACADAVAAEGGAATWAELPDTGRAIAANAEQNAYDMLDAEHGARLHERVEELKESQDSLTAWRVEGTLREFPHFQPVSAWFDWPLHVIDPALAECGELGAEEPRGKRKGKGKQDGDVKPHGEMLEDSEEFYREANRAIAAAVEACGVDGVEPTRKNIHRRIGNVNGKTPTYRQVSRWTEAGKKWAEWVPGRYAEDSTRNEKIIVRRPSDGD